jgi:hypothetical protein
MNPARMVKLTTVAGSFEAKVLAARLGAEGVLCELKGGVDGPYPFGPVHVYVEEPQLDLARELLEPEPLEIEADEHVDGPRVRRLADWPVLALLLVIVGILLIATAALFRMTTPSDHPSPPVVTVAE